MGEKKMFQGKKLNKKDNAKVKIAAKGMKKGAGFLMVCVAVGTGIKKYGKDVIKAGKSIIFKS